MITVDRSGLVRADADFPCACCGSIESTGTDTGFRICTKPETLPAWFQETLDRLFNGRGVPKEYSFCFRLTNLSDAAKTADILVEFPEHSGRNYLAPPYWLRGPYGWRPMTAAEATAADDRSAAHLTVALEPQHSVLIASAPFISPEEVGARCRSIADTYPLWSHREVGRTAEGRPIHALETPPRPHSIIVDATMQGAEPVAWSILSLAHWLSVPAAEPRALTDAVQLCLLPMTNPDGAAAGRSVTNGAGQVPKFALARNLDGTETTAETDAWWRYVTAMEPDVVVEVHSHNRWEGFWRAVGMTLPDAYPEALRPQGWSLRNALASAFPAGLSGNEIRFIDPRVEIHSVYGDQFLIDRAIYRIFLQAVSTSIEGQCADLQELIRSLVSVLAPQSNATIGADR